MHNCRSRARCSAPAETLALARRTGHYALVTQAADDVWLAAWAPPVPPHRLKAELTERWVRFYSLPNGKRYPETADEREEVRRRADTLLVDVQVIHRVVGGVFK